MKNAAAGTNTDMAFANLGRRKTPKISEVIQIRTMTIFKKMVVTRCFIKSSSVFIGNSIIALIYRLSINKY